MAGRAWLVQAQALVPSSKTGNAFTTTDGHELRPGTLPKLAPAPGPSATPPPP
jgi:hypothetical protein